MTQWEKTGLLVWEVYILVLIHALNLEVKLLSLCWVLWRILRAKMENLAGFAVSFALKKEAWREKEQKRELLNSQTFPQLKRGCHWLIPGHVALSLFTCTQSVVTFWTLQEIGHLITLTKNTKSLLWSLVTRARKQSEWCFILEFSNCSLEAATKTKERNGSPGHTGRAHVSEHQRNCCTRLQASLRWQAPVCRNFINFTISVITMCGILLRFAKISSVRVLVLPNFRQCKMPLCLSFF